MHISRWRIGNRVPICKRTKGARAESCRTWHLGGIDMRFGRKHIWWDNNLCPAGCTCARIPRFLLSISRRISCTRSLLWRKYNFGPPAIDLLNLDGWRSTFLCDLGKKGTRTEHIWPHMTLSENSGPGTERTVFHFWRSSKFSDTNVLINRLLEHTHLLNFFLSVFFFPFYTPLILATGPPIPILIKFWMASLVLLGSIARSQRRKPQNWKTSGISSPPPPRMAFRTQQDTL